MSDPGRRDSARAFYLALSGYLALTAAFTWPALPQLGSHLLGGGWDSEDPTAPEPKVPHYSQSAVD